jgi:predicted amidohydrolase YtcJ
MQRTDQHKLILNGKIRLEKGRYAEALLIENGRIVKTGSSKELLEDAPLSAQKIDASGALVIPAFYDSHLHLMWMGSREGDIECSGAKSIEEIIKRGRETIAKQKTPAGNYIQGAGVNPDLFTEGEKRDLNRFDVDKISTEHPVILSRHCGHIIYCNSLALRLAGLSESAQQAAFPDVEGGTVEKDQNGKPTGVFRENANAYIFKPMPAPSKKDMKDFLRLAMDKAHSLGISACGSYDSDGSDFYDVTEAYKEIYDESRKLGKPALRVSMQCGISRSEELLDARIYDYLLALKKSVDKPSRFTPCAALWDDPVWGNFLKLSAIKLYADGTLGGHTAWMRRPYSDKPETRGFPVLEQAVLERFVKKAAAAGMQVLVHAIGDAGIDAIICAYEKVTEPLKNPLRHGIIHCQITSMDLLERMAKNKILALVQPVFLADDMHVLESRVGAELASTSYAWNSMHKLDIPASYGTDAPVSPLSPLENIQWAVLRGGYNPGETVDIDTAFDAYTRSAAFSAFDENCLGRIAPGFLADLVFLDRDIFSIPPEEIHKANVLKTFCAGEEVFSK